MICPFCKKETQVVDSRLAFDGHGVRRRRECKKCSFRFSTMEKPALLDLVIVKREGRREAYDSQKLEHGLGLALRKRSYTTENFRSLVRSIEVAIHALRSNEITSNQLGEIVMDKLRKFDKVGYIRFASVYRQFDDVKTFEKELKALKKHKK